MEGGWVHVRRRVVLDACEDACEEVEGWVGRIKI